MRRRYKAYLEKGSTASPPRSTLQRYAKQCADQAHAARAPVPRDEPDAGLQNPVLELNHLAAQFIEPPLLHGAAAVQLQPEGRDAALQALQHAATHAEPADAELALELDAAQEAPQNLPMANQDIVMQAQDSIGRSEDEGNSSGDELNLTDDEADGQPGGGGQLPGDDDDNLGPWEADDLDKLIAEFAVRGPLETDMSKGEMIFLTLKLSAKHNLTHQATIDILQILNHMFRSPLLPETSYMLNKFVKMLLSEHVTYHFLCTKCTNHLISTTKPQGLIVCCDICNTENKVHDLMDSEYFVTFDLPYSLSKILNKKDNLDAIRSSNSTPRGDNICDIQDGLQYKELHQSLDLNDEKLLITLTTNSDGTPLSKSSNFSVWPVHAMINELPPHLRSKNLILTGLWFGPSKPDMQVFLLPFVTGVNKLSEKGMLVGPEKKMVAHVYCICCCVDSIARAPMQGMLQFNGYNACNWCHHPGRRVGGAMTYPMESDDEIDPQLRTAAETIADMLELRAYPKRKVIRGVKAMTPLMNMYGFDLVWSFVPDPLHCVDLGVVRQFTNDNFFGPLIIDGKNNEAYIGSPENIEIMDRMINSMKIPNTMHRHPRSVNDRAHWKGLEWENFLLVWSPFVLKPFLKAKFYNHWLKLVKAIYILHQTEITVQQVVFADKLLFEFVLETQTLYAAASMTYNLHQLLHLARSVMLWGPLWAHSGFVFEAGNGHIKKELKSVVGIPQQIIRHMNWNWLLQIMLNTMDTSFRFKNLVDSIDNKRKTSKSVSIHDARLFGAGRPVQGDGIPQNSLLYTRMHRNGRIFDTAETADSTRRIDGSYAVISDGRNIRIREFYYNEVSRQTVARVDVLDVHAVPELREVEAFKKIVGVAETILIPVNDIVSQCISLIIYNDQFVVTIPYVHIST